VPPRDAPACAQAIVRLLDDDHLARRLGAAARARVEIEFAEAVVVEKTMRLYGDLLALP
jgi:glycosyltransferase involved in cell wall biosynthesis